MKTAFRILIFAACTSAAFAAEPRASSMPQPPTGQQRRDLLSVRESVWQCWYKNDQATLKSLVPSGLIAIDPGEAAWKSRDQFLAGAQDFAAHQGSLLSLKFPRTEIQMFGNVAVLYSLYDVRFVYGGKPQNQSGRATEIFLLQNGKWVNAGWHLDSGK